MILGKKNLSPEKVADAILFLASDEAEFMTGEIITIDNGFELNHDLSFIDDRELINKINSNNNIIDLKREKID